MTVDSLGLIGGLMIAEVYAARHRPHMSEAVAQTRGLSHVDTDVILVSMTSKQSAQPASTTQPERGVWRLQDAKARFSELVRLAHDDGPQHVTLHGREAVVVIDADAFKRLEGARTGQLLIDALQASPHRKIDLEPARSAMPVRAVKL
jgi:prevent-host-death family protein